MLHESSWTRWKGLAKALLVGSLTGIAFGLSGFFLAEIPATAGIGIVMFLLVPFAAGFAIALVTRRPQIAIAAALLAALASLAILIGSRHEGLLCALFAFPLLLTALALGALFGFLFRRHVLVYSRHRVGTTGLMLLAMPALILGAHRAEQPFLDHLRRETVASTILVQGEPEQVWANIQSIDSIDVRKPWLMYFGLPVPKRCTLQRGGVGAKRICYFDQGYIEETITGWAPPFSMRLKIDRTNMPGRHWLGFESATYELSREGDATVVTRTTVITSHLYPAWYWRPLERLGVKSEHEYILSDLAFRIKPEKRDRQGK